MSQPYFMGYTPDGEERWGCDYEAVPGPLPDPTIDDQIDQSEDDAYERESTGAMNLTLATPFVRSQADAGLRYWMGLRFRNGPFPAQGSTVDVAYLTVNSVSINFDDPNMDIYCQDAAETIRFTTIASNITDRPLTDASAEWAEIGVGTGWVQTPSLIAPVQEVVDAYDPSSLVFILKPKSDQDLRIFIYAWDQAGNVSGAKLHLEWTGNAYIRDRVDQTTDDIIEKESDGVMTHAQNIYVKSAVGAADRYWSGVRFRNGPFPANGRTVTAATLELYRSGDGDANFDIYAEDAAAPATFTEDDYDLSSRDRTDASVAWVENGLPAAYHHSPSIVSVIQEIVNAHTVEAVALVLKPKTDQTKALAAWAYEIQTDPDLPMFCARLHVEWTEDEAAGRRFAHVV